MTFRTLRLSSVVLATLLLSVTARGQSFVTAPFAIDSVGETGTPSINPAVQLASIIFETDGAGHYRVIIDTHGIGGVGGPDGVFDSDDDWVWQGVAGVQPTPAFLAGETSVAVRADWDGVTDWAGSTVADDGVYTAQVELGALPATITAGTATTATVQIVIDTTAPTVSLDVASVSPNGDGVQDTATVTYAVSEAGGDGEFTMSGGPVLNAPAISLPSTVPTSGVATWAGTDVTGAALPDGAYEITLTVVDLGGNVGSASTSVIVDTDAPLLTDLQPAAGSRLNSAVSEIVVVLDPLLGAALDLDGATITLTGSGGAVAGTLEQDVAANTVRLRLDTPLTTSAENDTYSIDVAVSDEAGNAVTRSTSFTFDTVAPVLSQVTNADGLALGPGVPLAASDTLLVTLTEDGSGIDFSGASATLTGPSGALTPLGVETSTSPLLVSAAYANLSEEGVYTFVVEGVRDLAGNVGESRTVTFLHDTTAPTISELTPLDAQSGATGRFSDPLEAFVMTVSDELSDIDFGASGIVVTGPNGAAGGSLVDDGADTLTLQLDSPLSRLGDEDGSYTVRATVADAAGNVRTRTFAFVYDTQPPAVTGSTPNAGATVSGEINALLATVSDETSGVDFSGVSAVLTGPDGEEVPTSVLAQDADTVRVSFPTLRDDGSADGAYRLQLTLVDLHGNTSLDVREFTFAGRPPRVASLTPGDGSAANELAEISAVLEDQAGAGLDLDAAGITVTDPSGADIPGRVTHDGVDTVTFVADAFIATDGSSDGVYLVTVTAVDRRGASGDTVATVTLDTQAPTVVAQDPADGSTFSDDTPTMTVELADVGAGVDFTATAVALTAPDGSEVAVAVRNDGAGSLVISTLDRLTATGTYHLTVTPVDRAGNVGLALDSLLTHQVARPSVVSIDPVSRGFVSSLDAVVVTLADASGASTVEVISPNGSNLVGSTEFAAGTLTFIPETALVTDGRDDGEYTAVVVPADAAGNPGEPRSFLFTYDTQRPAITSVDPLELLNAEVFLSRSIARIVASIADDSSGPDLAASSVRLLDEAGGEVPGVLTDDNNATIWLQLESPLIPGGASDGRYTVEVTAVDRAGHVTVLSQTLVYDSLAPTLVSSAPGADETVSEAITSMTIEFSDAGGSGLDVAGSQITLRAPDGAVIATNRSADGDVVTVTFSRLTQVGGYILEAQALDRAGNLAENAVSIPFFVALRVPAVTALSVGGSPGVSFTNDLSEIRAEFVDRSGVGLDFTDEGSSIVVTGPSGPVGGEVVVDGSALVWTPTVALAANGADDGEYLITITPVDLAGRVGAGLERGIVYDSQAPRVVAASPADTSLAVTFVRDSIALVEVVLEDEGPAGIDLNVQSVELTRADGSTVAGRQANDGVSTTRWQLNAPLATDGSDDGRYAIAVRATDRAGNEAVVEYDIEYDTQAPSFAGSDPADGSSIGPGLTTIRPTASDSGSGIDASATALALLGPGGSNIPGRLSYDGGDGFTFEIEGRLTAVGEYRLVGSFVDRAGNARSVELTFFHAANTPTVVSTDPTTAPVDNAFAEAGLSEVTVQLQATGTGGISLAPSHSVIRLVGPGGSEMPGVQASSGANGLVYRLTRALADDGSDDGTYRIEVTPANAAGIQGPTETFTFVYDTQAPKIEPSVGTLFPQAGGPGAIAGFFVSVEDESPGSGIDWDAVNGDWMALEAPDGSLVDARVSGDDASTISLVTTTPLASDGSQDGEYVLGIFVSDRAGNQTAVAFAFDLDTTAPVIDGASLTLNSTPINLDTNSLDYPTSVNTETGVTISVGIADDGAGVDLARSSIVLVSPQGEPINGTLRQNNVDTLELVTGPLTSEGIYRITVTALGADASGLGIQPESTLGATFLFEKTAPTAEIIDAGGSGIFESEPAHITGTAVDLPSGEQAPASGVVRVEIGGTGPDGSDLPWEDAKDESIEQQNAWSEWSAEFLPSRSGKFRVVARVTDRAGNTNIIDVGTLEFTTALAFKGAVYVWPNPLSRSGGDVAHFSFATNQADLADVSVSVFDVSGTLVYETSGPADRDRSTNGQTITWNLRNGGGNEVASGIYVYRLELRDGQSTARNMGRILVVR
jgi:methionine-rich copper-binding protein CopC